MFSRKIQNQFGKIKYLLSNDQYMWQTTFYFIVIKNIYFRTIEIVSEILNFLNLIFKDFFRLFCWSKTYTYILV